jgi:hypothetical protein
MCIYWIPHAHDETGERMNIQDIQRDKNVSLAFKNMQQGSIDDVCIFLTYVEAA